MNFNYKKASDINEAVTLLNIKNSKLLAGGTNLLVCVHKGLKVADVLIDISDIEELKTICVEENYVKIGSMVTFSQIEDHSFIKEHLTCLYEAAMDIGGPQIRNVATVGGNIANASPAADSVTALIALNAEVELQSKNNCRRLLLADLFTGVGKTQIAQDELLTYIYIPTNLTACSKFIKVGKRNALAISIINMAINMTLNNDTISDITIAVGCVAPTVIRAINTEKYLKNKIITDEVLLEAANLIESEVKPIDDVRATKAYRLILSRNLLRKIILELKQ